MAATGTGQTTRESGRVPGRGDDVIDFSAQTPDGTTLSTRDFYMRRNLGLVFTHGPECAACRALLRDLSRQYAAAQAEAGELIAVIPASPETVSRLRDDLDISFPVVVDDGGAIHRRYGLANPDGTPAAAIIVADRYGTIFHTSVADEEHRMMGAEEVPGWLEFIACQCS